MSITRLPLCHADPGPNLRTLPGLRVDEPAWHEPSSRRDRIWDLSSNLHCSIVGTCLTTAALRQLFTKLNEPDAKIASDHDIHSRAVRVAGQRDVSGKMLNRLLDKRHEVHIKRFAKAKTVDEVRTLWRDALERGDIPGAYWAVLTHPATDQLLVNEVFGEVHMLSHLVGTSNRADIVRLRHLEHELGERDEKIARQEARLKRMAHQRDELNRRIETLEQEVRARLAAPVAAEADDALLPALKQRLADEQARSAELMARLAEKDKAPKARSRELGEAEEQAQALRHELASLEATLADLTGASQNAAPGAAPDLAGRLLFYVGGRPKQVEQLRVLTADLGGTLLTHDCGIEESISLLPGLISQVDAAFFPVDCVSHSAAGQVKRSCRDAGKPFLPLRSASAASFLVAIALLKQNAGG